MKFTASVCVVILSILLSSPLMAEDIQIPHKFVSPRSEQILSPHALSYLKAKAVDNQVKIWVFFTDKGVYDSQAYLAQANAVMSAMTERGLARRIKNNAPLVRFEDLPVSPSYLQQLQSAGLKLRRVSKWLNAASFETTVDMLKTIGQFPFVRKIQPVAIYTRPNTPSDPENSDESVFGALPGEKSLLNYGSSYSQLSQINVIAAHDSGYSGAGVWVAMFDTGFRKSHQAFANIISGGRLIAEYDFVFDDGETANEPEDSYTAWEHGTYTWSTLGGSSSGNLYGPAYGASFVLCKTEDVRSETQVEEDNWAAAVEWVDSIGVDVISSSLGYTDWYTYQDYDGNTCVITNAADYAASVGIVVCNSAGNDGPSSGSIGAPADADSILAVGAVGSTGFIVGFSSRGPTYDGRIKPEVCALGSNTRCAGFGSDTQYTTASGTSLACPLVGGAAALVIEAHPDWTVMQVREALMMTASRAATPDNNYGWGIINVMNAINYYFEPPIPPYLAGDANYDSFVDVSDAIYIINFVFVGGPEPEPVLAAGDANGDDVVEVSDAVYIVNYIFVGGPPPVEN